MNKTINVICSILALLCFVAMFMPVIAPRYPAGEYRAPTGNDDFYYEGDYYLARAYWTITDYASQSVPMRVVLSLDQAALLLWAFMSVQGTAGRKGLYVALFNLVFVGAVLIKMLSVMGCCQWGILAVTVLNMVAAVIMAARVK